MYARVLMGRGAMLTLGLSHLLLCNVFTKSLPVWDAQDPFLPFVQSC